MPGRMLVLELTSSTAAKIAGLADLPMTESKVNRDPIFTILGLEGTVEFTVVGPVLPTTSVGIQKQNTKRNTVLPITMMPSLAVAAKRASTLRKARKACNFPLQFFSLDQHQPGRTKNLSSTNNHFRSST